MIESKISEADEFCAMFTHGLGVFARAHGEEECAIGEFATGPISRSQSVPVKESKDLGC